jgi:hypothetical protein
MDAVHPWVNDHGGHRRVLPMFSSLPKTRIAFLLALLFAAAAPAVAGAGWMGFRNDTQSTLIIQETVPAGTTGRAGKPQKIYTNETIRDTPPSSGGQRTFTIADSTKPEKPLYTGAFTCPAANENVLFVIKFDSKGGVVIESIRTPAGISKAPPKK